MKEVGYQRKRGDQLITDRTISRNSLEKNRKLNKLYIRLFLNNINIFNNILYFVYNFLT